MTKIGLLMNGQGSEEVGMGNDLYQNYPQYRVVIDQASAYAQLDLPAIMNDATLLGQTRYAQPALVAMNVGINALLMAADIAVAGAIGLSLGEYAALITSGQLSLADGMPLVVERGALMQAAIGDQAHAMAAILKPDIAQVKAACATLQAQGQQVAIANYNSPQQIVVGGTEAGVAALLTALPEMRALRLPVKGAFHTVLFEQAALDFQLALDSVNFEVGDYPVISNTTEKPFTPDSIRTTLVEQMAHPTHFEAGLRQLADNGVTTFIEVGPGKTLSKFARQTVPDLARFNISNAAQFEAVIASLKGESVND